MSIKKWVAEILVWVDSRVSERGQSFSDGGGGFVKILVNGVILPVSSINIYKMYISMFICVSSYVR